MEHKLTKDAEKLISMLYELYLEKREAGVSKAAAKTLEVPISSKRNY